MQARDKGLDRSLAVLVGDRIDVADEAAADKHGALVAFGERSRVGHAGGVKLDVEARRQLEPGPRRACGAPPQSEAAQRGPAWRPLRCRAGRSGASPEAKRARPRAAPRR